MYDARLATRYQFGAGATTSLTSAGVDTKVLLYSEPCRIWRILFRIVTATVSTGGIVIRYYYRPVHAASTNQVTLGSITIPTAIAADKVYYKDITPYNMVTPGEVALEVITAAAGGGAAGAGVWDVLADFSPEVVLNETSFIASA